MGIPVERYLGVICGGRHFVGLVPSTNTSRILEVVEGGIEVT